MEWRDAERFGLRDQNVGGRRRGWKLGYGGWVTLGKDEPTGGVRRGVCLRYWGAERRACWALTPYPFSMGGKASPVKSEAPCPGSPAPSGFNLSHVC